MKIWVHGRADDINRADVPGYRHVMIIFSPSISLMDPPGTIAELAQWSQGILCVGYSPVWNLFNKQVTYLCRWLMSFGLWLTGLKSCSMLVTGID